MKKMKKIFALLIAMVMMLGTMNMTVYAATNPHTITINNTDANGTHTYEGYQVFTGNLNAAEDVMSDITWGNGVDYTAIINALVTANADNTSPLKGKFDGITAGDASANPAVPQSSATDVAKKVAALGDNSAALDAFAAIVSEHLTSNKTEFAENPAGSKKYTATVLSDGYYFIKDTTETLPEGDTSSKYILNVVKDVTINAKDTSLTPDKEILGGETNVKAGTAAIGDTVTFQVAIDVPDTTNYKDHFVFVMNDKLDPGMTFMGVKDVEIYDPDDVDKTANYKIKAGATPLTTLNASGYTVTAKTGDGEYSEYTAPATTKDAVEAAGGQNIKVVFNNFKTLAETQIPNSDPAENYIGKVLVVTYTAVVNDDATFGPTANKNEVEFVYSNDPNHDYTGDEPGSSDPTGTSPESVTKTYVSALEIYKYETENGNKKDLPGATFKVTGTDVLNFVKVTGETYITKDDFDAAESGTYTRVGTDIYYKLLDGNYTTTVAGSTVDGTTINDTQYVKPIVAYVKVKVDDLVTEKAADYTATATSNDDGLIEFKGLNAGTYTISIALKRNYSGTGTVRFVINKAANKITASNFTRSYSAKTQTITLGAKATGGTLTYKSSNTKVKVTKAGKVTLPAKFTGTVKITITAGNSNYNTVTKAITITVPSKTALSKVTSPSVGKMKVTWKKNTKVTGYQIQYSLNSNFASPKTTTITKNSTVSKTIGSLKKGKKYYVRIRSYKTVSGKKYYSAWSSKKTVTIKK